MGRAWRDWNEEGLVLTPRRKSPLSERQMRTRHWRSGRVLWEGSPERLSGEAPLTQGRGGAVLETSGCHQPVNRVGQSPSGRVLPGPGVHTCGRLGEPQVAQVGWSEGGGGAAEMGWAELLRP